MQVEIDHESGVRRAYFGIDNAAVVGDNLVALTFFDSVSSGEDSELISGQLSQVHAASTWDEESAYKQILHYAEEDGKDVVVRVSNECPHISEAAHKVQKEGFEDSLQIIG